MRLGVLFAMKMGCKMHLYSVYLIIIYFSTTYKIGKITLFFIYNLLRVKIEYYNEVEP